MNEIPYFPKLLTEMVGVGERSGNMEETLTVIGDYFDNEVSVFTQRLLSMLEPAITIVLAVVTVNFAAGRLPADVHHVWQHRLIYFAVPRRRSNPNRRNT